MKASLITGQETGEMITSPGSAISDYYHSLRANLEFAVARNEARIITLVSGSPNEGKTTTAFNLSLSYARSGKKILLIDGNLRSPTLYEKLGLSRRDGLSEYLQRTLDSSEILKKTAYSNLDFISSGIIPSNPADLLSSKRLSELFSQLRESYERIIVDTPSLFTTADAQIITAQADGVIMVVEHARTKRPVIQKAAKLFKQLNKPLLGTVLNKY